ncbi:MAG: GAF domain-containing protein [Thermodesulfobacteriota bacterium]
MEKIEPETYDKYIRALMDISQAITSEMYLEDILKLIVMVTAKVIGLEICSLWLADEAKGEQKLLLKATQSMDPDYFKDRSLKMTEGVVGYIASTGQTLIVEDVLKEPRFKEKQMAKKLGLASMIGVPLRSKNGGVIGVVDCFTVEQYRFSEAEINLIKTVANQAAIAIENARLLVKTKVIQEELETRKKIERAKEILMAKRGLPADKAFRWLQKKSMDTRKSMREIAEALIISQDL